jgi:tRNA1Val (adenine37-N6)-methyltransferase
MKVCTDACLLGAFVADKISGGNLPVKNILDIGTGTGLLSLMLAQKTNAAIDAVEMNEAAARQAYENIQSSPWANNIQVHHTSMQQFVVDKKYDIIISNPPFFEEDLHSPDTAKNDAKHDTTLTLRELLLFIKNNLSECGNAFLLLPYHRTTFLESMVKNEGIFIKERMLARQSPNHSFFRSILQLSKAPAAVTQTELSIHDNDRNYTAAFTALLQDYYLKL